jgi:hypothetical protein
MVRPRFGCLLMLSGGGPLLALVHPVLEQGPVPCQAPKRPPGRTPTCSSRRQSGRRSQARTRDPRRRAGMGSDRHCLPRPSPGAVIVLVANPSRPVPPHPGPRPGPGPRPRQHPPEGGRTQRPGRPRRPHRWGHLPELVGLRRPSTSPPPPGLRRNLHPGQCRLDPAFGQVPQTNAWTLFWVGFDGWPSSDASVEQGGTSARCVNGVAQYSAFYEMWPTAAVTPMFSVSPVTRWRPTSSIRPPRTSSSSP